MNRSKGLHRSEISGLMVAVTLLTVASAALAVPVNFVLINSKVNGPPYPTGALTADLVASPSGTPVVIDRLSSSIGKLNPVGAVDWFVAESFSFGVEREMKESGEHGGTEDINIGVGELQECTISKSMDASTTKLAQFAINGNSLSVELEFESALGKVSFHSRYTTPQPAAFTGVSVVPMSGAHSFDLNFSLLYSDRYNPGLSILNEVMTAKFDLGVSPAFEADFDEDGDVDGDDFTNWRRGFAESGATHARGDADADSDVDGGDFLVWQRQFGSSALAGSANAPVPEPATFLLFIVATAGIRRMGRRMRQELVSA